MRILLAVLLLGGNIPFLLGADVFRQENQQSFLERQRVTWNGQTSSFEWVLPQLAPGNWLTLGPLPPGQITLQIDPETQGAEVHFPEVSGIQVWLAWKLPFQVHRLRLITSGLIPPPLTLSLQKHLSTQEPLVALSGSTLTFSLPPWHTASGFTSALELSWAHNTGFTLQANRLDQKDASVKFHFSAPTGTWFYYPQVWKTSTRRWLVTVQGDQQVPLTRLRLAATAPQDPLPVDLATLLHWPTQSFRNQEQEWFLWQGQKNILILLTKDYALQARFLTRLAFFVEKQNYRGRFLTLDEAAKLHGWNAHDYAPEDLANFFNLASAENYALSPQEQELRQRLEQQKILILTSPGHWKGGEGALLGISEESPPPLRAFLLTHESFHGLYFTTPQYRSSVARIWASLPEACRQQFRNFLAASYYDVTDAALVVNEFQAYSLQQDSDGWEDFFRDKVLKAPSLMAHNELLAAYLTAAKELDQTVFEDFGFHSGELQDPVVFFAGKNNRTLAPP